MGSLGSHGRTAPSGIAGFRHGSDSHLAEKLAQYLSAKLIFTARDILEAAPDPQARWQCLRQFLPALALLRRDDMRFEYLHLATRRANRLEAEAKALAREKAESGEALQAELEKLTTFGAQAQEKLDAELRAAKKETAERWLQEREKASALKSQISDLKSPTGSAGIPAGLSAAPKQGAPDQPLQAAPAKASGSQSQISNLKSSTGSAGIPAGLSAAPKEGAPDQPLQAAPAKASGSKSQILPLRIPPNCTQLQPIQEIVKRNCLSGAVGPGEIRPGAFPDLPRL